MRHAEDLAQRGDDARKALALLQSGAEGVALIEVGDDARISDTRLAGVRADVQTSGHALHEAAERGDVPAAVAALDAHRLLCAHTQGPRGVQLWSALNAHWLAVASRR